MRAFFPTRLRPGLAVLLSPALWAALALIAPVAMLVVTAVSAPSPIFTHLADTVLGAYVQNSLVLVVGVCLLALLWGLPCAWLVARCDFPGRRFFRWALLLPLAMPAYLAAFVYTNIFDYAGFVQTAIRRLFGFTSAADYPFFEIRSMGGAMFVLSLMFAPYVYWIVSLNFARLPASQVQAARLLGADEWRIFRRVVLPLARPAIAVSCTLVAMETLADFGTVAYFSVWHLTTGIYDVWLAHHDLSAAAKLSCLMLLFVITLVMLEKHQRRHLRPAARNAGILPRKTLTGGKRFFAVFWCALVLFLGFGLPATWLAQAAVHYFADTDWPEFLQMSGHSLIVAGSAAGIAMLLAFVMLAGSRLRPQTHVFVRLASTGYAVPGTVLAIGVLIVTTGLDHTLNGFTRAYGLGLPGLVFSGTLFAMGYAFLCRFAAVGIGAVESGFNQIPASLDESAWLLGKSPRATARRVWLPLLRNSLLTAALLVFLESMKELSAAMLLRPFNVQTLATYIYEYMSAERFEMAAMPALVMVVAGLPTVLLLMHSMEDR
ncbi:MAG: iron ABC transporter permease [Cardiobacteriaceae bacterium]|nr:iron ABC transporter permease [Cardiobacteriaceae bacterium]